MVNKILVDTNVLLDYLLEREPFFEDAKGIMVSCDGEYAENNFLYLICNKVLGYIDKEIDNYSISKKCIFKVDEVE